MLDTGTLRWVSRLPVWFNGMRCDGKAMAFTIRNDRGMAGGGRWLFSGFGGRNEEPDWQLRVPCKGGNCKVDPKSVLDEALQSSAWK